MAFTNGGAGGNLITDVSGVLIYLTRECLYATMVVAQLGDGET